MNKIIPFIFLFVILISCTSAIRIKGFNQAIWQNDKNGCKGEREALVELLIKHKDQLLGKDQDQILELLGKPDQHEIYKRSQTFFIYSIQPGVGCINYSEGKLTANLTLRYNALGRVHEVIYYQ